jgi:hypothetical protein
LVSVTVAVVVSVVVSRAGVLVTVTVATRVSGAALRVSMRTSRIEPGVFVTIVMGALLVIVGRRDAELTSGLPWRLDTPHPTHNPTTAVARLTNRVFMCVSVAQEE